MCQLSPISPTLLSRIIRQHSASVCRPATQCAQLLRPRGHTLLFRLYSVKTPPPPPSSSRLSKAAAEAVSKRQAGAAVAKAKVNLEIPERLLIYHAGTGRTTFLAMLKVTTLFVGVFFLCVAVPGYVQADKPIEETVKSKPPPPSNPTLRKPQNSPAPSVALCGVVPLLFVTYTTAPFVTHVHVHLPSAARSSHAALERFVASGPPPGTRLTATTVSVIGKPRYSALRAGDLVSAARRDRRFGLVNYTRDVAAENATRRWYELPAVRRFHIPENAQQASGRRGRGVAQTRAGRNLVEPWIWDAIKEGIAKRAGEQPVAP
ncbi:hypothetical protein ISF_05274 [Cordyceps fumosorosea ARSEF 2679]|uniref:Uncharacterized protein n=1 Tax=Cordyceps fumosorosea (strain ARSEF 2679) TaxID=1081104 RepID=A0A167V639_CORFA|nr:hypothetical protein ISF_05274 [Cordyceps fumosorosea ARSEF 2679]OAA62265.1 hypothetical protein ISF_05274 [Cordyceps fumosorosea ARSEF 2679]